LAHGGDDERGSAQAPTREDDHQVGGLAGGREIGAAMIDQITGGWRYRLSRAAAWRPRSFWQSRAPRRERDRAADQPMPISADLVEQACLGDWPIAGREDGPEIRAALSRLVPMV